MSDDIVIRHLASQQEYDACVELQYETWGRDFRDAVPASILQVSQHVGGITAGAFRNGQLVGFVFGITGVENGQIVHWSDMLAVRVEQRGHGLGRTLKEFQRREVAKVGAKIIYWTFDPLVARNAHLNFNVFGVRVVRYVRNMYGENTRSTLHRDIGTDRLVVAWDVDQRSTHRSPKPSSDKTEIEVPGDIEAIQHSDPARALEWRQATRDAFERALGAGLQVESFALDAKGQRGVYRLGRA